MLQINSNLVSVRVNSSLQKRYQMGNTIRKISGFRQRTMNRRESQESSQRPKEEKKAQSGVATGRVKLESP
jgi:hypothetical protein